MFLILPDFEGNTSKLSPLNVIVPKNNCTLYFVLNYYFTKICFS